MAISKQCTASDNIDSEDFDNNGLIIGNLYIPVELILKIMCAADEKTVLNCHQVCKRWRAFAINDVWHKKAEMKTGHKFRCDGTFNWQDYYLISTKNLFDRNLVRNHSGEEQLNHWNIIENGGEGWAVECPPVRSIKLSSAVPEFENKQHCFVTSYSGCYKEYVVNLIKEGFSANILDQLQPPIEISEWYTCRSDCPSVYMLQVQLLDISGRLLVETFEHPDNDLRTDRASFWFKVHHVFRNYGKGLRKIRFLHGGRDRLYWAGHYGCKMAGAYVAVQIPQSEDRKEKSGDCKKNSGDCKKITK